MPTSLKARYIINSFLSLSEPGEIFELGQPLKTGRLGAFGNFKGTVLGSDLHKLLIQWYKIAK